MSSGTAAGLCRLTVRAPTKAIDLAVPADVPVADLLPAVLGYGGDDLGETGLEHEGWVLQRLGGAPLDQEATLESLGLRDGDTVYLRPRTEALPEVRLDDIVHGISTTMKDSPHGWSPLASRRLLRGLTLVALLAALAILALPGGPAAQREIAAGAFAMLLLAGAAAASRAVGDAASAALLGGMVGPYLVLAGWLLPGGKLSGPEHYQTLGARLLAASAAEAGGSVLALAVVAAYTAFFVATTIFAVAGALAGVLVMVAGMPPEHAAAIVALAAVAFGAFVPSLSFRLSGLRTPPLPTNAEQLQEGIEPRSPSAVAARAVLADTWMTALYATVGLTCALCVTELAQGGDLSKVVLAAALSLLLLLHSRGMGNVWQRLSLVAPGVWGAGAMVALDVAGSDPAGRVLPAVGVASAGAAFLIAAWVVPGRRLVPYWGRAAEILHSLVAVSLLPLALWVLGLYGTLRAIG
ncbi:type VII secretion integral membrane protein EccD [Actinomadura sp. DC4]|uniref:type VII secretion integral membrane protein EccD n=1 Tax=Actinomadura sp. DC4 TaxID=3055069 RepID=UPI0025B1C3D8|nr:type VII secretion integral membrane protein EccD [Actinomadura sp. DC4]MDN3354809.1 type VII secretion integral membrane protein EccD [Actinomadura sp. DC4]